MSEFKEETFTAFSLANLDAEMARLKQRVRQLEVNEADRKNDRRFDVQVHIKKVVVNLK
jgi:hypothetical protein